MVIDFHILTIIVLVIYLEGILSIDNAAVLGALVADLPQHEKIPWPRALRFLAAPSARLLGGQRTAALKVGILGAYVGQTLMLALATVIIQNPWLKILGGLYLIKLASENLGEAEPGEEAQVDKARVAHRGFWSVVVAVEFTDLAFSLDNVVAVAAISRDFWVIMFGVALAIVMLRFAASIFTRLISLEPLLKPAAYVVVLNIGVELLLEELAHVEIDSTITFVVSLSTLVLAVLYARIPALRAVRPVLHWLGEGLANVNEILDWALVPIRALFQIIVTVIRGIAKTRSLPSTTGIVGESALAETIDDPPAAT